MTRLFHCDYLDATCTMTADCKNGRDICSGRIRAKGLREPRPPPPPARRESVKVRTIPPPRKHPQIPCGWLPVLPLSEEIAEEARQIAYQTLYEQNYRCTSEAVAYLMHHPKFREIAASHIQARKDFWALRDARKKARHAV